MKREEFLLKLLASIFAYQALVFGVGLYFCGQDKFKSCPDIADRYENTFNIMIATSLALISNSKPKE